METWQHSCERTVAKKAYSYIRVLLAFDRNVNQAWFDGIHLFKDEFGNSYAYDDDGNVTSVSDLQKKSTTYEYSSNNLTKAVLPNTAQLKYTYDGFHNVLAATSGENVKDVFAYDFRGNNTSVKIVDPDNQSGPAIEANAAYTGGGNLLASVTDGNRGTAYYGYNSQTRLLEWVQGLGDTEGSRTGYAYNGMQQLVGVSKNLDSASASTVSYAYDDNRLGTVTHGGTSATPTTYAFEYAGFGALREAKIGGHILVTNTYDNSHRTFNLLSERYGNGHQADYAYDSMGRVLSKAWNGSATDRAEYIYDNEGGLAGVRDVGNNILTKYTYDLSGRLV